MATIKKVKKAADGIQKPKKPTPTYKNLRMGVNNENYLMSGQSKNITPSAKDSGRYRGGFEQGLKGMKGMPNEGQVEKAGRWEGQNVGKKKPMKMGGKMKKAKEGTSLGMKSVKAGFDKNPGVTRADVIVAAKGQAKKGKMVKKAMAKKAPMSSPMMKKGGKMTKKCAYGCK